VGRIGFGLNCIETPTQFVVIVQPLDEPSEAQVRKGYKLQVSTRLRNDPRALDPAMKSGNYLNSLLSYLDAAALDFDDALLCNQDGHLTEGTTFNVGYIRRGILATPPLDIGILDGITRRTLLGLAEDLGIPVREVRFPRERLYEADEVFLCSTIKEIFPVTQVDEKRIGRGKPGELTLKLRKAFRESALKRISK
jgi:branched-chain amino acid aminotransferase